MPNATTRKQLYEAQLRTTVAPFARSQIGMESVIEDYMQGYGEPVGFGRAREIITEEYARVRDSAAARIAAGALLLATTCPVLPITADGLAEALRLAGWSVRWNTTARHVEARRGWRLAGGVRRPPAPDDGRLQAGCQNATRGKRA